MSRKQHSTGAYSTSFNLKQLILLQLFLNGTLIHQFLITLRVKNHSTLIPASTENQTFFPRNQKINITQQKQKP